MNISTNYGFYKDFYGGIIIPSLQVFQRLSIKATNFINKITFNNIKDEDVDDNIMFAICSVADEMYKIENTGGIKSVESVGNYSVSYKVDNITEEKQYIKAAKLYISQEYFYRGFYR